MTSPSPSPAPVSIGDLFTYTVHTDRTVYEVVRITAAGRKIVLRRCRQTLLNGANSGEPDALVMIPGGFAAHTTGTQRWEVESDPEGEEMTATYREKIGCWKPVGSATKTPGFRIRPGSSPHYDFNF